MIDNKLLYELSRRAGLNRQTLIHRAKDKFGLTPPLSYDDFAKVVVEFAANGRVTPEQRKATLNLLNDGMAISEEREHPPFFRKNDMENDMENGDMVEFEVENGGMEIHESPIDVRARGDMKKSQNQPKDGMKRAPKPNSIPEDGTTLTYAQTAGNAIRKMDGFAGVLMFLSMLGVSYTLYTVGAAFSTNVYFQIFLGVFVLISSWKWEGALKEQINTFMHQAVYKLWGGRGGAFLSTFVLLTLLAPNIYQGVIAAKNLSSVVAPIHTQDDGQGINKELIEEKNQLAEGYVRTREALKKEQETAALADPLVAKFAGYERSERNTAAARRREAEKYRNKGERSNMNWCLHLAKQAEKKAETWRMKKEQASTSVYASYAALFTKSEQQEKSERERVEARYQGLLAMHSKSEFQKRENSERKNEGMMMIGLIFLPIADFVVLLLIYLKVSYFYRTGQIDPSLKAYKVGEKSKLEQVLSGVVGPAIDTLFGLVLQVGYRYQAMAQASLDGAGAIQQLMKERAVVRHQNYQRKIAEKIERMKSK